MNIVKSDLALIRKAENLGLMVGMTGLVEQKRTDLNNELSDYFRKSLPNYSGSFDEDTGEDILYSINEYLQEKQIDKPSLDFPFVSGSDVHLIPINENIALKVIVADEYYGDGEYAKYVMANFFKITEHTTKSDVDELIEFVKTVLK